MARAVSENSPPGLTVAGDHQWSIRLLASAAFLFVTAETLPIGLLPQIADGLHVSEARVGLLLTMYAAIAGITAIPLTMRTSHIARDRMFIVLLGVFTITMLLSALAPSYPLLAASRIVCAVAHGVFWSMLAPTIARLAGPKHAGRATSLIFIGISLSRVIGLPAGTAIGVLFGWRTAMAVIAVLGFALMLVIRKLLPTLPAEPWHAEVSLREVVRSKSLQAIAIGNAVIVIGGITAYTYIAPLLDKKVAISGVALSLMLLAYGVGGLIGSFAGGRFVDSRPGMVLIVSFALLVVSYVLLAICVGHVSLAFVAMFMWGLSFSAIPLCFQSGVLHEVHRGKDTAQAVIVVSFQVGIGGGALAGGFLVDGGHLLFLPWFGLIATLVAVACAFSIPRTFPMRRANTYA